MDPGDIGVCPMKTAGLVLFLFEAWSVFRLVEDHTLPIIREADPARGGWGFRPKTISLIVNMKR